MVIPSVFEGLSLTTIESQIAGVPVIVSSAIPEEAVISNGCVRLDINSDKWVEIIMDFSKKEVKLDNRSNAYRIEEASRLLCDKYMNMVGD